MFGDITREQWENLTRLQKKVWATWAMYRGNMTPLPVEAVDFEPIEQNQENYDAIYH